MVEEINTQYLQDNIDAKQVIGLQEQLIKIKQIIDCGQLYTFIVGVIGTTILCICNLILSVSYGPSVGFGIFGGCIGLCYWFVQKAKSEYNKLLGQLQQIHNIQK